MKTTFIITNFKRLQNLPQLVDSIKSQTIESEIFIWNNNPTTFLTQDYFSTKIDLLINSTKNMFCAPRWDLCKFSKNDFVFIIDDDIYFSDDDIVEHILWESKKNYIPGRLFGVEGVILDSDYNYFDATNNSKITIYSSLPILIQDDTPIHFANPDENINVDVVKGRLICLNKNDLSSLPPPPFSFMDKADDITYSLWLSKYEKYHMLIGGCKGSVKDFDNKNAAYALSMEDNWKAYRNSVVKEILSLKELMTI